MGFSAYLAGKLAAQYSGTPYSWPTTVYLALFSVQPVNGTGGTEANYTGYARVALAFNTTNFTVSANNVENALQVAFPTNTGSTGQSEVGYGLFDAATGGNLLHDNLATTPQTVNPNSPAYVPAKGLSITFTVAP
jgi:hypothetical protein